MTPVRCHSQATQCTHIGIWRGDAARPFEPLAAVRARPPLPVVDRLVADHLRRAAVLVDAVRVGPDATIRPTASSSTYAKIIVVDHASAITGRGDCRWSLWTIRLRMIQAAVGASARPRLRQRPRDHRRGMSRPVPPAPRGHAADGQQKTRRRAASSRRSSARSLAPVGGRLSLPAWMISDGSDPRLATGGVAPGVAPPHSPSRASG